MKMRPGGMDTPEVPGPSDAPTAVGRHIETIAALERQALEQRTRGEYLGDTVAVLMSDRRTHLDLQVNLLIETEVTKVLRVMERICEKMDVDLSDEPELKELTTSTDLRTLVQAVETKIPEVAADRNASQSLQEPDPRGTPVSP